jgi:hypothetical protein
MIARELERSGYRAALSISCADAVRGTMVADGLAATAWRPGDDVRLAASRSPVSGLLGYGLLPGLGDYQQAHATGGAELVWPPDPAPQSWLVSVVDTQRRYLPVLLEVAVPVSAPVVVPLHSAVSRSPLSGWAVVRGEVHDRGTGAGLPWPVVTVTAAPQSYEVIGDQIGRFLLIAPYPEALPPLSGSPPAGPGLGAMTWSLGLTVRSEPGSLDRPSPTGTDPPELGSILGQAAAQIDVGGVLQPSTTATLAFANPTVLTLPVQPA